MNNLFRKFLKIFFLSSLFINPTFAETDFTISVENIIEEFKSNSIVAEEKFLKKKIKIINGEIFSIDDSIISDKYVTVTITPRYESYSFNSISCSHTRDSYIIRELKKGMKVDVIGILESESTGLNFNDCNYFSEELKSEDFYYKRALKKISLKQDKSAIKDLNIAISMNPNDAYYYMNLGTAERGLGNSQKAINAYSKAININPEEPFFYLLRGYAKMDLGNIKSACNDWNTILRLKKDQLKVNAKQMIDNNCPNFD